MIVYNRAANRRVALWREDRDRVDRILNTFYGPMGGALGETLTMLASNNLILHDVHLLNVGWRSHSRIACHGEEDKTLCIFDPGHTPVGRGIAIPTVRVQNPYWT